MAAAVEQRPSSWSGISQDSSDSSNGEEDSASSSDGGCSKAGTSLNSLDAFLGRWRCFSCHTFSAVCLLVGQVALLVVFVVEPAFGDKCKPVAYLPSTLVYAVGSIAVLGFAVFFVYFTRDARDAVTARATRYALLASAMLLALGVQNIFKGVDFFCAAQTRALADIAVWSPVVMVLFPILAYNFFGLVEERVRLTEAGFGASLGSLRIRRFRRIFLALDLILILPYYGIFIVGYAAYSLDNSQGQFWFTVVTWASWVQGQCHNLLTAVTYMSIGLIAFHSFTLVLRVMELKQQAPSYTAREMRWAQSVFDRLRWITVIQGLCSAGLHFALIGMYFQEEATEATPLVFSVVQPLLFLMEIGFLLTITGYFKPQHSAEFRPSLRPTIKLNRALSNRTPKWHQTVEDLVGRGLSLGALLDFYEMLGKPNGPMPHYDPERSTTNDIVRQVIIPCTRTPTGGGFAYATKLSQGAACLPQVMVTHTWTGLFLDLVAGVVADARGRNEYRSTALEMASGDCERLREHLERRGVLGRTYWICAFSVNQHSGICSDLGKPPPESSPRYTRWDASRKDTATGRIFSVCECSQPKYFNDLHPEECELNKFDSMMEMLSTKNREGDGKGLSQLIVVDRGYTVFERAWCVAELHRAYTMRLAQKVCLYANRALDIDACDLSIYKKLAMLTVVACQASRAADKEDILKRIPDTQEFDAQLQEIIFGNRGLLARQIEGFGVLEAAARTAFRVGRMRSTILGTAGSV